LPHARQGGAIAAGQFRGAISEEAAAVFVLAARCVCLSSISWTKLCK
jgi:hypothetical protein